MPLQSLKRYGFTVVQSHEKASEDLVESTPARISGRFLTFTKTEVAALILSVKVAIFSLVFIFPPGLFVSWLLAKYSFRGKSLLNTIVMLPLVLPPVVCGYFLLMLFSREGPVGNILMRLFGLEIVFSWVAVVLAISVISFPLFVRSTVATIEGVNTQLESAARTLGCPSIQSVLYRDAAFIISWNNWRRNTRIFQKPRRIRCNNDDSREYSRKNTDIVSGNIQLLYHRLGD